MYYHLKASFCFTFIGLFGLSETVMKDIAWVEAICQKNQHFVQAELLKNKPKTLIRRVPQSTYVIWTYSSSLMGWEPGQVFIVQERYLSHKLLQKWFYVANMFLQAMSIHKFCVNLPEVQEKSLQNSSVHVSLFFFHWLTSERVLRNLRGPWFLPTYQTECWKVTELVAEACHTEDSLHEYQNGTWEGHLSTQLCLVLVSSLRFTYP